MAAEDYGGGQFLYVEGLPADRRAAALEKLKRGEVVIEKIETSENGKTIIAPGGMIHDWIGTVFISGVTLQETLALEEDYDRHQDIFQPEVMRSKILRRNGGDFTRLFPFAKKENHHHHPRYRS